VAYVSESNGMLASESRSNTMQYEELGRLGAEEIWLEAGVTVFLCP
jgi:hypothetical protein